MLRGAGAQAPPSLPGVPDGAQVALVLSGGGAKGFAHIGVLQALGELGVSVDLITGTSMGAMVGGLHAIGYTPAELQRIARGLDWEALFTDARDRTLLAPDRRAVVDRAVLSFPIRDGAVALPTGVVRGEQITRLLERLTWRVSTPQRFRDFPIPFAAVATDAETGIPVMLDSGSLATAIRASISLPGALQPVALHGRLLIDGGIARNLPATEAIAMGATVLICSDVAAPLESAGGLTSFVGVLLQTISFQMEANSEAERQRCDILVRPSQDGLSLVSFGDVDAWVQRGADATFEVAGQLAALRRTRPPAVPRSGVPDSVSISRLELRGLDDDATLVALRALELPDTGWIDAARVDSAVARLYASNLFGQAHYHLAPRAGGDTALVIDVTAETNDRLGIGFRYDDHRKASLLFSASLQHRLRYGSTLQVDLRLGEELQLDARYLHARGVTSGSSVGSDARFTRALFDVYAGDAQVAQVSSRIVDAGLFLGRALRRTTLGGLQLRVEHADAGTVIAPTETSRSTTSAIASLVLWSDTFDRTVHPRRGTSVLVRGDWATRLFAGEEGFRQAILRLERVTPIHGPLSGRLLAMVGVTPGGDVPVHRRFFLGGAYPSSVLPETQPAFWGLAPQQRTGRALHLIQASIQFVLQSGAVVAAGANVGGTAESLRWAPGDHDRGYGLMLGLPTLAGPVEVTLSGRSAGELPALAFSLGHRF